MGVLLGIAPRVARGRHVTVSGVSVGQCQAGARATRGRAVAAQVWKDDQLMFETKHEAHVGEITDFAMLQPEAMVVRHNQQDTCARVTGRVLCELRLARSP